MDLKVTNNLQQYLTEIYKIPMLTDDEEKKYAQLKEQGDLNAAKILINSHLRLVVKIAYKYKNYGLPMMDIISEGNLGLMRAVKEFTLEKGCKLATYAMWWIRASIQDFILRSWSLVKIGTTAVQKKLFFNLQKIKNNLLENGQKELTSDNVKYISNVLNVPTNDVVDMENRLTHKDVYLNKTSNNDEDGRELIELIKDSRATPEAAAISRDETNKKKILFKNSLSILNDREREILFKRRLGDKQETLQELSKAYGVSSERIRQIEEGAISKIKNYINKNL